MSADTHDFWSGIVDQFGKALTSSKAGIKKIGAVSGNAYQTYDSGAVFDPYSAPLARISRNAPVVGDRVFVAPLADGTYYIVGKVYESGENDAMPSIPVPAGGTAVGTRIVTLASTVPIGPQGNVTLTANRCYFCPVYLANDFSTTGLCVNIATAVAGNLLLELYDCATGNNFAPVNKLASSTIQTNPTTGVKVFAVTPTGVFPGGRWYFIGLCASSAMAVTGSTTRGNFPSFRGQLTSNWTDTYCVLNQSLTAGWSSLPTAPAAGSGPADTYLHVGIQIS